MCLTNVHKKIHSNLKRRRVQTNRNVVRNTNNNNSAAIPLKEGGIARLIHFFAAVGARKDTKSNTNNSNNNKDASLSSAFVGALINDPTTDWNKADPSAPEFRVSAAIVEQKELAAMRRLAACWPRQP